MVDGTTDRDIHFRDWEPTSSKSPLILVRGFAGNADSWHKPFLDNLAHQFRIIIFDNRGTGRSQKPQAKEDYSMAVMAEDLRSVVTTLQLQQFHLMGLSMGGCIALEYARRYRTQLMSLFLVASHAGGESYVPPEDHRHLKLLSPIGETWIDRAHYLYGLCISQAKVEKHWEQLLKCLTTDKAYLAPREALEGQLHGYLTCNHSSKMKFSFPVHIICGDSDPLTPPANSQNLAMLIQDAQLHIVADCEHIIDLERPDELAQLIIRTTRPGES
jgi:3-oxoadipate enol-lactonase